MTESSRAGTIRLMKVWVIGAGFSRSLGGPLLNDLLSKTSLDLIRRRLPGGWAHHSECDDVVELLKHGAAEGLWTNPEEYIAALGSYDPRCQDSVARLMAKGFDAWEGHPESWSDKKSDYMNHIWIYSIRMAAAQCMCFLSDSRNRPESWLPYRRWALSVGNQDVIVSFNYDETVEAAFMLAGCSLYRPNVRLGQKPWLKNRVTLMKLHGGVEVRDTIKFPPVNDSMENLDSNPPEIAVPGISKGSAAESEFDELWEAASEALAKADEIAIIGYSLPPSDQVAKAMLLDSLSSNKKKPVVDIVLGPRGGSVSDRLVSMLRLVGVATRETGVWAEDYLTAMSIQNGWELQDFLDDVDPEFEDIVHSFRKPTAPE